MNPRRKLFTASLLVLAASGSSFAAILTVPSAANPTIADAILHANPNDTISISAGEYRENLAIPPNKTGLTFVGSLGYGGVCPSIPGAIVDGGASGTVFDVEAVRTSFRCLEIRHGSDGIYGGADYLTVQQSLFVENAGNAISTPGGGAKILYNMITGAQGDGIRIDGSDALVRSNSIKLVANYGIEFYADRTFLDANTVSQTNKQGIYSDDGGDVKITTNVVDTTGDAGIQLDSNDNATVAANHVSNALGYGVYVSGINEVVTTNQVENTQSEGIYVIGDDPQVKSNIVRSAGPANSDTCIYVDGDRARIEGNTASICFGNGIYAYSHDAVVKSNKVEKVNDGFGIEVYDDQVAPTVARVELNTVNLVNGEPGIFVDAEFTSGFTVLSNVVTNVPYDGLVLSLSNAFIQQNSASYCGGLPSAGGIFVIGSANLLNQNIGNYNVAYGIETNGCGNKLTFNQGRYNQDNGIVVGNSTCAGPDTIDHNTTQSNQGEGLSLLDGAANVTFNNSLGNRKTKGGKSGDCTSEILGVAPQTFNGNVCSDHSDFHAINEIN